MRVDHQATVLIVGTYRSTIHSTRLLARAGHTVIVARDQLSPSYAEYSKYAAEVWNHPSLLHDRNGFFDALMVFLSRRPDITVIFPVGDVELLFFAHRQAELPGKITVVMPAPSVVETCENKVELMKRATELGVPQAAYALVENVPELVAETERLGYPCVIKASDSHHRVFGKKALICADKSAVLAAVPEWPAGHKTLLVQCFASGKRINIHSISQHGKLIAAVQTDVHRTDSLDNTGIEVDSTTAPVMEELMAQCETLASAFKINGMALFQFIVDETAGVSHLLEVNPRMSANFTIASYCGLHLPVLAVSVAQGVETPFPNARFSYAAGKRTVWTMGDLTGLRGQIADGTLSWLEALKWFSMSMLSFARADVHVTWAWADPLPTLAIVAKPIARRMWRLFGSRK